MKDFAAIDFETANYKRDSACSVGVVVVRNGMIVDKFYSLINPGTSWFCFTDIHGLTKEDTDDAPGFPEVWARIVPMIEGLPLVAHNCSFDRSCLMALCKRYGIPYPDYTFHCTCSRAKIEIPGLENYQLHTVAAACGYDLTNHHEALADAEACAYIAIAFRWDS